MTPCSIQTLQSSTEGQSTHFQNYDYFRDTVASLPQAGRLSFQPA